MQKNKKLFKEILDRCLNVDRDPLGVFVIGSCVYDSRKAKDIDPVIISRRNSSYRNELFHKKPLKISQIPFKNFKKDIEKRAFGTFISGRLMNPLLTLYGDTFVLGLQKLVLLKEMGRFFIDLSLKSKGDRELALKSFIVERSILFPSYMKNVSILRLYKDNPCVRGFLYMALNLDIIKRSNFPNKERLGIKELILYWETRANIKSEKYIDWYEVFKRWKDIKLSKELVAEFNEIAKRILKTENN